MKKKIKELLKESIDVKKKALETNVEGIEGWQAQCSRQ